MDGKTDSVGSESVSVTPSTVFLCAVRPCRRWRTWGAVMGSGSGGGISDLSCYAGPAGKSYF